MWPTVLLIALTVSVIGCGSARRREVWSLFFDCVPGQEAAQQVFLDDEDHERFVLTELDRRQMKRSKHKGFAACDTCHVKVRSFTKQTFRKPMPDMCYDCHGDYNTQGRYVHGPTAVGECTICHNPHSSDYIGLLRLPQPKLCEECHDAEDYFVTSESHPDSSGKLCTECHDPHVSNDRMFLKE